MYYIERGAGLKWLAVIFALLGGVACFGIGNIAQSTEIAGAWSLWWAWIPFTPALYWR